MGAGLLQNPLPGIVEHTDTTHGEEYPFVSEGKGETGGTPWQAVIRHDDIAVSAGPTCCYWVRSAANSSEDRASDFSLFEIGPQASPSLVPPTGVSATDGAFCGFVRVSWNAVVGATHYQVYRSSSATEGKTAISSWQAGANFDDTTVSGGSLHYYWVRAAIDNLGSEVSEVSAVDSGYAAVAPSAPSGVAASDGTTVGVVRVTWKASPDVARYEVYRDGTMVGIAASSQFDDVPGDSNVHQYMVKAWNICGTGAAAISDGGNAGINCPQIPLLADKTPGTLTNNYSGWVGMRFVVASSPMQVRALGRIYVNGNTRPHEMRLIHAETKATVAGVLWTPPGEIHNQIKYAPLAAPVTLSPNTEYYLVSKETAGGDSFYGYTTAVSTTGAVQVLSAIESDNGTTWAPGETAGSGKYGPVSLIYCGSLNQLFPPTGATAGEGTLGDKVSVTWNAVSSATHYQVYRAMSRSGTKIEISSWQAGTSYDDTTATAGVTYYYWIKAAADGSGGQASDFSAPHAGWRALPPLPPPTGVATSDGTLIDKVKVTWDAVAGATNYQVYRAESEAGTKVAVTPWRSTVSYDDTTTTAGLTYYYWVKASVDGSGSRASGFSVPSKGRRALGAVNPATGVSASDGSLCGLIRVNWNPVAGAAHYRVYRAPSETGTKIAISPWQATNSYDDTTAAPESVYHYWVKATIDDSDEGSGEYSLPDTGYAGIVPPAPTGVAANDGTFINYVRITWNASPGATSYEVYRDGTLAGNPASSPYDDAPGDFSAHVYVVRAKNACGISAAKTSGEGPIGCNCCKPSPLLKGSTQGKSRNDYTGWAGIQFMVGSNPLVVRALGRIYINGNTQDHELRLIHGATNTMVASVLWTPSGGIHGQIHYAVLAEPVILAANTNYYLAGKEMPGSDPSVSCNMAVATTNAASGISPVYSRDGSTWTPYGTSGNNVCGGVDLMYCVSSQQFPPPTGVFASNGAFKDKVRVTWNAVSGATNYQVYRAASAEEIKTAITAWQPGTTFDDATTPAGSTVYYWIKAALDKNGGQASDFSATASGWRTKPTANPPTGVSASDGVPCGLVRMSWKAVAGATHYQAYRASSETGTKIAISPWQAAITYDDIRAPASASFYWVRAAMDDSGGGAGEFSSPDRGFAGVAPIAPAGIAASDGTYAGFVRVTWKESQGATDYDVYQDGVLVGTSRIPTYDDAPGDYGTHQYRVLSRSACGASTLGLPDSGRAGAPPACEPNPLLTGATLGSLRNDYSGWVGMRFVVGSTPLQVRALGRIYVEGNTQNHQLRLVRAATGTTAASVLWMPAGGTHNQIKYATLPAPAILAANTEYYLASQETAGGDVSYGDNTRITIDAAAGVLSSAYSDEGSMWWLYGALGSYGYGPLDLKYCELP
jgi:fibronectin type 3 domain-containing protein